MEELVKRLNDMPESYFGFVAGVVAYVKNKPERFDMVMKYMDSSDDLSCSDVVGFIMSQPDFHDDGFKDAELVS